jgi:hypothetical protein
MEFFSVVVTEGCPTTSAKVAGRYFRADTMNSSIRVAKIATSQWKKSLPVNQKVPNFAVNFLTCK